MMAGGDFPRSEVIDAVERGSQFISAIHAVGV